MAFNIDDLPDLTAKNSDKQAFNVDDLPDLSNTQVEINRATSSPITGLHRAMNLQRIGAQQIGSDLMRMLTGEIGQPKSGYRNRVDAEGRRLQEESTQAGLSEKVGEFALPMAEFGVLPNPRSFAGRLGANALTSGIIGALSPNDSGTARNNEAIKAALFGAAIPAAGEGVAKLAGVAASPLMPKTSAINQLKKLLGGELPTQIPSLARQAENPNFIGPVTPRFGNVPGIKPTVGMIANTPELLKLEMNARLRSPEKFYQRDAENTGAVYRALEDKTLSDKAANQLQDALNLQTSPLRDATFAQIARNPSFADSLKGYLAGKVVQPGIRGSSAMPIMNKANTMIDRPDVAPEDLHRLREELGGMLKLKTIAPDELTSSAKANRQLVTELISKIDGTMNNASNGQWSEYLKQHSQGMQPINEGRSIQDMLDRFSTSKKLFNSDIPAISPNALRKAVDSDTYYNAGKQGYVSTVGDTTRNRLNDAIDAMNQIETAKGGTMSVNGSPTATFQESLLSSGLLPKNTMTGKFVGLLHDIGLANGANTLDNAMLNPNELQSLLDLANKPKSKALKVVKKALKGIAPEAVNQSSQ